MKNDTGTAASAAAPGYTTACAILAREAAVEAIVTPVVLHIAELRWALIVLSRN